MNCNDANGRQTNRPHLAQLPRYSDYMLADTEISTTFENVEIESSSAGGFLKRKLEEACSLNADQVKVVDRMGMDEVRRVFGKDAKVLTVWIKNSVRTFLE